MIKLGITGKMASGKSFVATKLKMQLEEKKYQVLYISVDEIRRQNKTSDIAEIKQIIVNKIDNSDSDVLLLEWALLLEDGMASLVDNNILIVHCSENKIYQRLANPDIPIEEIRRRLDVQTDWFNEKDKLQALEKVLWLDTENGITDDDILRISISLQEFDKDTSDFCLFRIPKNGGRVIWEVTNRCNYRCPYCIFSSSGESKSNELNTEQALNLICDIKKQGYTHLKITGGEPFIRKDIMDILEYSKNLNLRTDISTNASLITEKIAKRLSDLVLEMVHVSLDGHTKKIHEIARGKNTFNPTVKGIKNLTTQKNIYVRIGCLIFKENEDYLKEIAEFSQSLGANEIIFSLMEPVGRGNDAKDLISEKPIDYLISQINNIHLDNIKVRYNFSQAGHDLDNCSCPGGKRFLFINSVGEVSPCTWISERVPEYIYSKTLHECALKDILNENKYTDIVSIMKKLGVRKCPAQNVQDIRSVQELKDALDYQQEVDKRFTINSPSYLFTTENLQDTFKFENISNVLTIGASGDHFFNSVLCGAKEVDCFDINIFSKYIIELKKTAIENLSYVDFIQMFFKWDKDIYTRIRQLVSIPCRYIGDLIFSSKRGRILKDIYIPKMQLLYNCNYLDNEKKYNILKKLLSGVKLNFILSDIRLLHNKLDKKYDLIHLSNISDYAHLMFEGDYLNQFYCDIINKLSTYLSCSGFMICGYVYDALDRHQSSIRSKINSNMAREEAFAKNPTCLYSEKEIKTAVGEDNFDTLLIIKRNNDEKPA